MPRKSPSPAAEQAAGERYMCPPWFVRMFADHHRPALPHRVLDAGCADGRLGLAFNATAYCDIDLSALPAHAGRRMKCDFFSIQRPRDPQNHGISIVTNPPFTRVTEWIRHCLHLAGDTGDVAVVLRTGVLQQVGFPFHPVRAYLPKRRVQFEVTPEDATSINQARALEDIARGRKPRPPLAQLMKNGRWRLGSPADDHGIYVFRNTPDPAMPLLPGACLTQWIDVGPYLED